jgi:hypothetical protein
MSGVGIVVGAATGIICALIATPILKSTIRSDALRNLVYIGIFAVSLALAKEHVAPPLERHLAASSVEDEFLKNPAFVALKAYERETYTEIVESVKSKITAGASPADLYTSTNSIVQSLVAKRVPITSNSAALQYMRVTIDELRTYYAKPDDKCYLAMFPEFGSAGFNALPIELQNADFNALATVLRDAKIAPQPIPTETAFTDAVGSNGLAGLDPSYHADLDHLGEPKSGVAQRRRACEITMAIFAELFKLPPERAGVAVLSDIPSEITHSLKRKWAARGLYLGWQAARGAYASWYLALS